MQITNDYIRGLVDGEGCFTFHTRNKNSLNRKEKVPAFAISMNQRDKELLEKVRNHLGIKNKVYLHKPYKGDGFNRGYKATLVVREIGNLKNIIVPFFYEKLIGYKAEQFQNWLEKIGNDPDIPETYRLIYRLHKCGYYQKEAKYQ